jgi:hypothetical protein
VRLSWRLPDADARRDGEIDVGHALIGGREDLFKVFERKWLRSGGFVFPRRM